MQLDLTETDSPPARYTGRAAIPPPRLDLTDTTHLLAQHLANADGHLGYPSSDYLTKAQDILDLVAPNIEAQVLQRAARRFEHLNLTGATVIVAEQRRIVFAFRHHLKPEHAVELWWRIRASLPGDTFAVVVDGVEVTVDEPTSTEASDSDASAQPTQERPLS